MTFHEPPVAGVIGWPVAHSKSPLIHRFWLEALGVDGDYSRFPVAPDQLQAALCALPALGLRGVNVTVPHKQAVIGHLDRIDPAAAAVGAVNTVVVEDGKLVGYNTDGPGFLEPLDAIPPPRRRALLIGAGGAGAAIAHALAGAGYAVTIRNRDRARAAALSAAIDGARTGDGDPEAGLVINATTLGMAGAPPLLFDIASVRSDAVIYDIVYAPLETPLLAAARARGNPTIDGLAMLIGQAREAFRRFYGMAPPRDRDGELRARLLGA